MALAGSAKRARRAKRKAVSTSVAVAAERSLEPVPTELAGEDASGGRQPEAPASMEAEEVASLLAPPRKTRRKGFTATKNAGACAEEGGASDVLQPWQPSMTEGEVEDRRGVIHLASVPMMMKVEKLRHLMEQFGEVGRIYLAPEDAADRKRRVKSGGNRKVKYTEGWVEFAERKLARRVAESLNGTSIGGKKRHNFYRDDLWNVKYLPKFKWHMLKEANIYNRQVQKARLEQKVSQAKRENDFYLERVEQAKHRSAVQARVAAKATRDGKASDELARGFVEGGLPRTKNSAPRAAEPRRKLSASGEVVRQPGHVAPGGDISDRILASLF